MPFHEEVEYVDMMPMLSYYVVLISEFSLIHKMLFFFLCPAGSCFSC
uniref:Uncharacterized protein n=1 Tax=Arundo donax TaxID=35708 RepID=A0A0A9G3A0_ARUDO